jgi:p-aminobenzoyl-glutamate transporter AbgT
VIELVGHSGTHAPQAIHSSVIFIAMGKHSLVKVLERFALKITLSGALCQMTNVSGFGEFVTESKRLIRGSSAGNPLKAYRFFNAFVVFRWESSRLGHLLVERREPTPKRL